MQIPRGAVEDGFLNKLNWDKITQEKMIRKYQAPLGKDLNNIFRRIPGFSQGMMTSIG